MSFRITGLSPDLFQHLFGLSDEGLAKHGAKRYVADTKPGYPDRIEMRDAEPGETLILLNYIHQPANNAYHASHAIFVIEDVIDRLFADPHVAYLHAHYAKRGCYAARIDRAPMRSESPT